jgi:hypothetical protein
MKIERNRSSLHLSLNLTSTNSPIPQLPIAPRVFSQLGGGPLQHTLGLAQEATDNTFSKLGEWEKEQQQQQQQEQQQEQQQQQGKTLSQEVLRQAIEVGLRAKPHCAELAGLTGALPDDIKNFLQRWVMLAACRDGPALCRGAEASELERQWGGPLEDVSFNDSDGSGSGKNGSDSGSDKGAQSPNGAVGVFRSMLGAVGQQLSRLSSDPDLQFAGFV